MCHTRICEDAQVIRKGIDIRKVPRHRATVCSCELRKLASKLRPGISFLILFLFFFETRVHADDAIRRRILVIPFDNVQKNANYQWMSESISDNLKTELVRSGRFEVLDVALLKKIDPTLKFTNLTDVEATQLATRLNCEAAVFGRFIITKDGRSERALIQTEGLDALAKESVVIKSQYAELDGNIFSTVQLLAEQVSAELVRKLPPLTQSSSQRNEKLEKIIKRLENPPKGFLDGITLKGLELRPEFDIDVFEYEAFFVNAEKAKLKSFEYELFFWIKAIKPILETNGLQCRQQRCTIMNNVAKLSIKSPKSDSYYSVTIRLNESAPTAERTSNGNTAFLKRWWLTAGYPFTRSLPLASNSNPNALYLDGGFPLDAMRGYAFMEVGASPARWQLPAGISWSLATQYMYGSGIFSEFDVNSGVTARVSMLSLGAGVRFDRPFVIGGVYSISPLIGFYGHYQRFFRSFSTAALNIMALAPEIGFNQTLSLGKGSRWRFILTIAAGGFFYATQNLSYARAGMGVEYALK